MTDGRHGLMEPASIIRVQKFLQNYMNPEVAVTR
jgi:hypothetical protein